MCKKLKFYFTNSKRNSNNLSSFLSSFLWISPGIKCPYRLKPIHKKEPQSDSSSAVRKHTPLSLHIIYLISLKNASFYYFFKHSNTPLTPQPLPEHYSASYLTSSEHIIRQESVLSSLLTFMILFFWYSIHKKPPTLDLSKVDGLYQSVDATGFEPATSASRTQRSTKLSHASMFMKHFVVSQIVLHYIITSFSVCPEKFCIFLIFLKFQTKPPKIYDIMNSDEFILEVPAELRMRRK